MAIKGYCKSESVSPSVQLALCNPMDCNLPDSPVHGIFQARILEWTAIPFPRGSSRQGIEAGFPTLAGRCFTVWATRKPGNKAYYSLLKLVNLVDYLYLNSNYINLT